MRLNAKTVFLLLPLTLLACHSETALRRAEEIKVPATVDTILLADINLDGNSDTAFVANREFILHLDENGDTSSSSGYGDVDYINDVQLSGEFPGFAVPNSIWGRIENAGDLDLDGTCELLFCTHWFTTSFSNLYLYQFHDDAWHITGKARIQTDGDESLRGYLVKKGKDHYLRGVTFSGGDAVPDDVKVELN